MWAMTSSVMPDPVSATVSSTQTASVPVSLARTRARVAIVIVPFETIASRALTTRFSAT